MSQEPAPYNVEYTETDVSSTDDDGAAPAIKITRQVRIAGYRELTRQEGNTINGLKEAERLCNGWIDSLVAAECHDPRWIAIGRTHIEQGFMALVRSVARPGE